MNPKELERFEVVLKAAHDLASRYLETPLRQDVTRAQAVARAITPHPHFNVVGVGVAEKVSNGQQMGSLGVTFLVVKKFAKQQIEKDSLLPATYNGVDTDVVETGLVLPTQNPRARTRPAPPGSSVGYQDPTGSTVMAGTFGALVQDGNGRYVLSNNHVLADENGLPVGSPIYQPGLLDGGQVPGDQIASLSRFVPLQVAASNLVDCAIAQVADVAIATNAILQIGPPAGSMPAAMNMPVEKFGRTSGFTTGTIMSIAMSVTVAYDMGSLTFTDQIWIQGQGGTPFSAAGDSGSLVLDRSSSNAVGLLFGGSQTDTFANQIADVLNQLGVSLV